MNYKLQRRLLVGNVVLHGENCEEDLCHHMNQNELVCVAVRQENTDEHIA